MHVEERKFCNIYEVTRYIMEMVQDNDIFCVKDDEEIVCAVSIGNIAGDLELP